MRVWSWLCSVGLIGLASVLVARGALAGPSEPARSPRGALLVGATASWQWQVLTAPRLAPQIGALAVSGLDVVAGRGAGAARGARRRVRRRPAWPYAVDAGQAVIPRAAEDERIAAAFGVTTFELAADDQGLAMLELRVRYQDGVAVWLNGVEVVRQALPARRDRARPQAPRPRVGDVLHPGRARAAAARHQRARDRGASGGASRRARDHGRADRPARSRHRARPGGRGGRGDERAGSRSRPIRTPRR